MTGVLPRLTVALACVALPATGGLAIEPAEMPVRVSVKRVLDGAGDGPTGRWRSTSEITRAMRNSNDALARSGSRMVLELDEIVDATGASNYYEMAAHETAQFEQDAKADPDGFGWRDDAINIYVVDSITNAGGICSFPGFGSHREIVIINSRGILGGSEGWLHEIGHYLNLIHTHEGDQVADTVADSSLPDPFDCRVHDSNFDDLAATSAYSPADTYNVRHNVVSYHCDPRVFTPLQVIRMRRALADWRPNVVGTLEAVPSPVPAIALPPGIDEGSGHGVVPFSGAPVVVELDGTASRDGLGGRHLRRSWEIVESPELGAAVFLGPASSWELGYSSLGYGDDDDFNVISDMRDTYVTLYLAHDFELADPAELTALELDVTWDDGFAAYLNGVEVARRNLGPAARHDTPALSSGEATRELVDLTPFMDELVAGANRLAIEVHNGDLDSSDLSMHPALRGTDSEGERVTVVPSRASWYFQRGSGGAPPAGWSSPVFDPSASRAVLELSHAGMYRVRLTVDQGVEEVDSEDAEALRAASTEITLTVGGDFFVRADCNLDDVVDVSDAVRQVLRLFVDGIESACPEACDANDDGADDISDAVYALAHIFTGGPAPPAPFPEPGLDVDEDGLGCSR